MYWRKSSFPSLAPGDSGCWERRARSELQKPKRSHDAVHVQRMAQQGAIHARPFSLPTPVLLQFHFLVPSSSPFLMSHVSSSPEPRGRASDSDKGIATTKPKRGNTCPLVAMQ